MKKLGKILSIVCLTMAVAVCAVMFAACGGAKTYTASYTFESKNDIPASPIAKSGKAAANGYYRIFGNFADSVNCNATLEVEGKNYTYTWKVLCGTEDGDTSSYQPEFVWTGKVVESTDSSIKLGAAETAKVTIYSFRQTATNAETTSIFGVPDYVATHETTDCPYKMVPAGTELLNMFSAGTYEISGKTLGNYTVD